LAEVFVFVPGVMQEVKVRCFCEHYIKSHYDEVLSVSHIKKAQVPSTLNNCATQRQ